MNQNNGGELNSKDTITENVNTLIRTRYVKKFKTELAIGIRVGQETVRFKKNEGF